MFITIFSILIVTMQQVGMHHDSFPFSFFSFLTVRESVNVLQA